MITTIKVPTTQSINSLIDFFYEVHHDPKSSNFVLLPNGNINIVFFLSGGISFNGLIGNSKAIISCICTNRISAQPTGKIHAIGAQLNPIFSHLITNENPFKVVDSILDLEDFYSKSKIELTWEQMNTSPNTEARFNLLESFILKNHKPKKVFPNKIHFATELIKKSNGNISIEVLSNHFNISKRGLRKIFLKDLGMGPKEYSMIQQFNFAVELIKSNQFKNLTDIAYQAGYNDQAHFIKQFTRYAQITPGHFNKVKLGDSDFYNFQLNEE